MQIEIYKEPYLEHLTYYNPDYEGESRPKTIVVNDKMQQNYRYVLTEAEGKNFDSEFHPDLTPIQMLNMGVFEGKYMTDCWEEFPERWFETAILSPERSNPFYNYFGVKSRLSLAEWRHRGWIAGPDVRGWFQWYCRYYYGRRLPEIDCFQIMRWKNIRQYMEELNLGSDTRDFLSRKQTLLQWACNPNIY